MGKIVLAIVAGASLGAPVIAQSYDTGGLQLSLGVTLGASAEDNRALDPDSAGTSSQAQARLSFGLLSETPIDRLALTLDGTLRAINAPDDTSQGNGFVDPGLALSYDRTSAAATLGLSASLRESDLAQETLDETGLDTVTGTATRRQTALEARLNWGEDTPLGFGVFARQSDTRYRDGTATGLGNTTLDDSRRRTLGITSRMDLDQIRTLDLGLTWSDFESELDPDRRESLSLDGTFTQALQRGALTASLGIDRTEEGARIRSGLGRSLEMPWGQVSGQIGLSRGASGDTYVSGSLDLSRDMPQGAVTLGLARAVTASDTDDSEQLTSRASLGYDRELTPLSGIRFGLNLFQAEETATGIKTSSADASAIFSHELPSDWTFATGYTHRIRDEDGVERARSNRIFLELRRDFVTRY